MEGDKKYKNKKNATIAAFVFLYFCFPVIEPYILPDIYVSYRLDLLFRSSKMPLLPKLARNILFDGIYGGDGFWDKIYYIRFNLSKGEMDKYEESFDKNVTVRNIQNGEGGLRKPLDMDSYYKLTTEEREKVLLIPKIIGFLWFMPESIKIGKILSHKAAFERYNIFLDHEESTVYIYLCIHKTSFW